MYHYYKVVYTLGTLTTNPAANAVMATTGAINEGGTAGTSIDMQVVLTSSVPASFKFQLWNGTAEVGSFNISVPAADTKIPPIQVPFQVPNDHHVRVLCVGTIVGIVQCSILSGYRNTF
jgi:Na+/serine symporter